MEPPSTAGHESSELAGTAIGRWRPQFGLRWLLALTAWVAAIMALAVSSLNALVMSAIGFSVAALNCAGKLSTLQSPANHRRAVGLAWLLLLASLGLPAVRGCGNDAVPGYSAAAVACAYQVQPPVVQPLQTVGGGVCRIHLAQPGKLALDSLAAVHSSHRTRSRPPLWRLARVGVCGHVVPADRREAGHALGRLLCVVSGWSVFVGEHSPTLVDAAWDGSFAVGEMVFDRSLNGYNAIDDNL